MTEAQNASWREALPVRHYSCEEAAGAEAMARVLAEQEAGLRNWTLENVQLLEQELESCGMRSGQWLFFYTDEKAGREHVLVQRLEFTDATPLYVRFPRDCFLSEPVTSWDALVPALLAMQYGEDRARPLTEGGNCERPVLQYEDELLQWNEQTGYFEILRHWEVHQPCPNGAVYRNDQYLRGLFKAESPAGVQQPCGDDGIPCPNASANLVVNKQIFIPFLNIYPNPSQNDIGLSFSVPEEGLLRLELLDARGLVIQREERYVSAGERAVARFSLSDLPAGMYWVRLCSGEVNLVKSVVKMK